MPNESSKNTQQGKVDHSKDMNPSRVFRHGTETHLSRRVRFRAAANALRTAAGASLKFSTNVRGPLDLMRPPDPKHHSGASPSAPTPGQDGKTPLTAAKLRILLSSTRTFAACENYYLTAPSPTVHLPLPSTPRPLGAGNSSSAQH